MQLVSQIVLLDPVCLLLFLPNVARAFLHPEQNGLSFADKLMLNLVTQEKGISHTLRRHFWWYAVSDLERGGQNIGTWLGVARCLL